MRASAQSSGAQTRLADFAARIPPVARGDAVAKQERPNFGVGSTQRALRRLAPHPERLHAFDPSVRELLIVAGLVPANRCGRRWQAAPAPIDFDVRTAFDRYRHPIFVVR